MKMYHEHEISKHRSTIIQLYVVFIITVLAGFVPNGYVQGLAVILLLVLMIAVPLYGLAAPQGSILKSHMRYLNQTIWAGSFFLAIGAGIMAYWVYQSGDHSAFLSLQEQIHTGSMVSEAGIYATIDSFISTNMGLIVKSFLICVGPPMLYIIVRTMRGLNCATQGDHV